MKTFICDNCGEEKEFAEDLDEEAKEEACRDFGIEDTDSPDVAIICDDCYNNLFN